MFPPVTLIRRRFPGPVFPKEHIRSPRLAMVTWFYIILALVLGYAVPQINRWLFPWLVSPLDRSTISTILSAIGAGMITLTGIVFSLVFIIVQFGSSTYSPRITRIFAHTHALRHSLGIFTGTFLYSLMALRTIGLEPTEPVSAITVWVAFLWLLASIMILAGLVRVFTTLTVGNVLFSLSLAGRLSIARIYVSLNAAPRERASNAPSPNGDLARATPHEVIYSGGPGYVIRYRFDHLLTLASESDTVIHLPYAIGDSLRDGEPVAFVHGVNPNIDNEINRAIVLGRERAFRFDPRYALRLLVDMAIRALSPAINDPTTAVQALDHIEMLLHRLGSVNLDIGEVRDEEEKVRVVYAAPTWEDFLRLGLLEIMQYGAESVQVQRRLGALLSYLSVALPPSRTVAVDRFAEERLSIMSGAFREGILRDYACVPDRSGLG